MPDMKTVRGRVETDIEDGFSSVDEFSDFFLVRYLGDKPSCNEFFVDLH